METIYNHDKTDKWKKLLGEQTYSYCEKNNEKFRKYLSEQLEIECDIGKEIEQMLLEEVNYRVGVFSEEEDI